MDILGIGKTLLLGALGSLLAMLLWQLAAHFSGAFKGPLDFLASFAGGGVIRKYRSFNQARKHIVQGVKESPFIKFMAIRGFPGTQETYSFNEALEDHYNSNKIKPIQVLIADPEGDDARQRAEEYEELGHVSPETYISQIRISILSFADMKKRMTKLECRVHNSPAAFRILLFERYCLVGFYTSEWSGRTSPVLLIKSGSPLYKAFDRYFDQIWLESKKPRTQRDE